MSRCVRSVRDLWRFCRLHPCDDSFWVFQESGRDGSLLAICGIVGDALSVTSALRVHESGFRREFDNDLSTIVLFGGSASQTDMGPTQSTLSLCFSFTRRGAINLWYLRRLQLTHRECFVFVVNHGRLSRSGVKVMFSFLCWTFVLAGVAGMVPQACVFSSCKTLSV
jgi:hypothetical protein